MYFLLVRSPRSEDLFEATFEAPFEDPTATKWEDEAPLAIQKEVIGLEGSKAPRAVARA